MNKPVIKKNNDKKIIKVETETPIPQLPSELPRIIEEGKVLVQTRVPYVTAIKVQVPRNLDKIVEEIKKEAEYAGETFYYSWELKSDKSWGAKIEGGSIGLASALVRTWGNCVVPVMLEETEDTWIFTTTFIDLETGFNLQRIYRYRKDRLIPGRYDPARAEDMAFQAAQSRAIRNVILTAMPKWLTETAIELAKKAVIKKIDFEGISTAIEAALKSFAKYNITEELLIKKLEKPKSQWTTEDIATLKGLYQGIRDGQINPQDIIEEKTELSLPKTVTLEEITGGGGEKK